MSKALGKTGLYYNFCEHLHVQKSKLWFRLVGTADYTVSQLWGQKEKAESLKLKPSKHAINVKDADKVRH